MGQGAGLVERLRTIPTKLGAVAERIFQGLVTGADSVFILTNREKGGYFSDATNEEHELEQELMHPLCKGAVNLRRYRVSEITKSILFPYRVENGKATLFSWTELQDRFPKAAAYLLRNRLLLEARERGKWKHDQWYAFGRSQNLSEMEQDKILTPSIAVRAAFTLDRGQHYYFMGSGAGGGGGYGITIPQDSQISYEFLLGLLNSKLLDYYLREISSPFRGGYYAYNRQYIEPLPIVIPTGKDGETAAQIGRLAKQALSLHAALERARIEQERTSIERQIAGTEAEIDRLVYQLYGLNEKEVGLVESARLIEA